MSKQKNVKNLIMNVLPDNRPLTSLQIVEDHEKCPANFVAVNRTYDQDSDADLWRETILFGKRSTRYLCLSKSEGLPDYIVETLKVCNERELPGEGFSILTRTADNEHKAWRKRQICYRLARRGSVSKAVTDVILCSKIKTAPEGFTLAGDINGITVCYKTGPVVHRAPPSVPIDHQSAINELENNVYYMNIRNGAANEATNNLNEYEKRQTSENNNDYELLRTSYHITPPLRFANKTPIDPSNNAASNLNKYMGTLGAHTEMDGIPFILNPAISIEQAITFDVSKFDFAIKSSISKLEYSFNLERQILCATKTPNSTNPFFAC